MSSDRPREGVNARRASERLLVVAASDESTSFEAVGVPFSVLSADFCSVWKAFIGSNYLAVPYAFHLCGLTLALPLFAVIALATRQGMSDMMPYLCLQLFAPNTSNTAAGCQLLLACKMDLDKRVTTADLTAEPRLPLHSVDSGYGDIGRRLFGTRMQNLVKVCCRYCSVVVGFRLIATNALSLPWPIRPCLS